jgi:hypothetical protein
MNNILCGKIVTAGDFDLARFTSLELQIDLQELWAGSLIDGVIQPLDARPAISRNA